MKKFMAIILVLALILSNASLVFADTINKSAIKTVSVKGQTLQTDSESYFFLDEANRTMAPLRLLCENLGATVSWDNATDTATVVKDSTTVKITIGQKVILVNGKETAIDTTAKLVNEKTFLPLRAVSEAFGFYVSATGSVKNGMTIAITTEKPATTATVANNNNGGTLVIKKLTELTALNKAITDNGCTVVENQKFGPFTIEGVNEQNGFNFTESTRGYEIHNFVPSDSKQLAITNAFFNEVLPPELATKLTIFTTEVNAKMNTLSGAEWTAYFNTIKNQDTTNYNGIVVIRSIDRTGMQFTIYK